MKQRWPNSVSMYIWDLKKLLIRRSASARGLTVDMCEDDRDMYVVAWFNNVSEHSDSIRLETGSQWR